MFRINKTFKKCASALLAFCMIFSTNGISMIAEEINIMSSVKVMAESGAIWFNDEMEKSSTTVIIKHWHLVGESDAGKSEDDEQEVNIVAREIREEYRFYYNQEYNTVQLYKKSGIINPYLKDYDDDKYFEPVAMTAENGVAYIGNNAAGKPVYTMTIEQHANDTRITDYLYEAELEAVQGDENKIQYAYSHVDETFSNFSVSSGQRSVDTNNSMNTGKITITYDPDSINHLVKGHVFYIRGLSKPVGVDFSETGRKWLDLPINAQDDDHGRVLNPYWNNGAVVYTGEIDTQTYNGWILNNAPANEGESITDENGNTETAYPGTLIYYNTSSGLHTDKTASVTEGSTDGRTFDVDLKAWYSGEDIADIGFVLDASGSMGWTTDVIEPFQVDPEIAKNIPTGKVLTTAQVNKILNTENTDNALLSYTEYNYYIYDRRDTVSEFVPIGYWNGAMKPDNTPAFPDDADSEAFTYDLIGYYPFENSLENKAKSGTGKMIAHAGVDGIFDTNGLGNIPEIAFNADNKEIDVGANAKSGAMLIDTNGKVISTDSFTIALRMSKDYFGGTGTGDTPILYIGSEDGTKYFEISKPDRAFGENALRIRTSGVAEAVALNEEVPEEAVNEEIPEEEFIEGVAEEEVNEEIPKEESIEGIAEEENNEGIPEAFNEEVPEEEISAAASEQDLDVIISDASKPVWETASKKWTNLYLVFDRGNLTVYSCGNTNDKILVNRGTFETGLVIDDAKAILSGNINGYDSNNFQDVAVTGLCAFDTVLSEDLVRILNGKDSGANTYINNGTLDAYTAIGLGDEDNLGNHVVSQYPFDNQSIQNVIGGNDVTYIKQASDEDGDGQRSFDVNSTPDPIEIEAVYDTANKYKGNYALDITETAKTGAVLLDAVPKDSKNFTFSFAVIKDDGSRGNINGNTVAKLMYIGDKEQTSYFELYRRNAGNLELYHSNDTTGYNTETNKNNVISDKNHLYFQGAFTNPSTWHVVTFVIKSSGDSVEVIPYVDGKAGQSNGSSNLAFPNPTNLGTGYTPGTMDAIADNISLILAGLWEKEFNNDYTCHLYLDELYVFDEALTPEKVKNLYNCTSQGKGTDLTPPEDFTSGEKYDGKFSDDKPNGSDFRPIYNDRGNVIGWINNQINGTTRKQRQGWYYINSHSNWQILTGTKTGYTDLEYATGKQFIPVSSGIKGKNDADAGKAVKTNVTTPYEYTKIWSDFDAMVEEAEKYTPQFLDTYTRQRANQFIMIEVNGIYYLVCTFWNGNSTYKEEDNNDGAYNYCSFVYSKPDGKRIKVESLQYALNSFTAKLHDESPESRVSAVRFSISTNNINAGGSKDENDSGELDRLVLLDWNDDGRGGIVSGRRTTRQDANIVGTADYDWSDPTNDKYSYRKTGINAKGDEIPEYNYFLTGGTYTWTGLKAFYTQLVKGMNTSNTLGDIDERYELDTSGNYTEVTDSAKEAKKYVIVFTDGRDNDVSASSDYDSGIAVGGADPAASPAKYWADQLKKKGYTIFCVMLSSGSVSPTTNADEYNTAKTFLSNVIAGPSFDDVDSYEGKLQNYEVGEDGVKYVYTPQGDAQLSSAFDEILEMINSKLENYTVKDYIDPRFNLIDARGRTFYLNSGGSVTVLDQNGNEAEFNYHEDADDEYKRRKGTVQVNDLAHCTYRAFNGVDGHLHYDFDHDMYYLDWINQNIPGSAEGSTKVEIWESQIRLKAKDDFIGGNEILTNGNLDHMNYVYNPRVSTSGKKNSGEYNRATKTGGASSGTEWASVKLSDKDEQTEKKIGYPSKGFPRTTVNVRLLPMHGNATLSDKIYMGEAISPAQLLVDIEGKYNSNLDINSYYLEYLKRYAYQRYLVFLRKYDAAQEPNKQAELEKQMNMTLIDLLNEWLNMTLEKENDIPKSFSIPYMYLPSPEYDQKTGTIHTKENSYEAAYIYNNTGGALNEQDVVGVLTYKWKKINSKNEVDDGVGATREYVTNDTEQVKYILTVEYTPLKDGDMISNFDGVEIKQNTDEGERDKNYDGYRLYFDRSKSNGKFFSPYLARDVEAEYINSTNPRELEYYFNRSASVNGTYLENSLPDAIPEDFTEYSYLYSDNDYEDDGLIDEIQNITGTPGVDYFAPTDRAVGFNAKVYRWNPEYKPAVGNVQLECERTPSSTGTQVGPGFSWQTNEGVDYGDAGIIHDGRTLMTESDYIIDIISGGLALELEVPKKELLKAYDTTNGFKGIFTATATRAFTDTDYIEERKANMEDFDNTKPFEFTFTFNYSADEIKALLDAASDDSNEIIKLFARATEIKGNWKYDVTSNGSTERSYQSTKESWNELPIGTYTIDMSSIKQYSAGDTNLVTPLKHGDKGYIPFTIFGAEENDQNEFAGQYPVKHDDSDYVGQLDLTGGLLYNRFILNGFNTTHEKAVNGDNGILWATKKVLNGNTEVDQIMTNTPEIDAENINDFRAVFHQKAENSMKTVTFYLGTDQTEAAHRGDITRNTSYGYDQYLTDRLGIILLRLGNVDLELEKQVQNTAMEEHLTETWEFEVKLNYPKKKIIDDETVDNPELTDLTFPVEYLKDGKLLKDENGIISEGTITFADTTSSSSAYYEYTAKVYLKHDQKIIIKGLPDDFDVFYAVDEVKSLNDAFEEEVDYAVSYDKKKHDSNTGILKRSGGTIQVICINEFFSNTLPELGGSGINHSYDAFGYCLIIASMLVFGYLLIFRRRKKRGSH